MEYEADGRSVTQFIGDILVKIRERGIWHCLKRLLQELLYPIIRNISGILAYPFCFFTNTRFISFFVRSIGHLCVEPDCYIKEELLGMRPKYNSIVLALRGAVANQHLLNYWKRYNMRIIESPFLCFLLGPLSRNIFSGYNVYKYAFDYNPPFPEIQKRCYGRPPLLKLTESDRKRGWEFLEKAGMIKDSWFVCVHCREESFLGEVEERNRSCDINNYLPAIREIVRRGGWVIRVGDSKMKFIPRMQHVIDYAHLGIKSDWMDVFLSANCRFFLGSNSGLCHLPTVFGVPGAIANCVPISAVLPYGADDIGIPKLVWSNDKQRFLTFPEIFNSPASNYRLDSSFSRGNIKPIENSPEDITELALEMLDKVEGKLSYTEEDEVLQRRFKFLMNPSHCSYGAISRVGRGFLRKYANLLGNTDSRCFNKEESGRKW